MPIINAVSQLDSARLWGNGDVKMSSLPSGLCLQSKWETKMSVQQADNCFNRCRHKKCNRTIRTVSKNKSSYKMTATLGHHFHRASKPERPTFACLAAVIVAQSCPTLCDPTDPASLLCPWDFPGKNTGVDCHSLLQRIFLTQELNLGLLYCRRTLSPLSYREHLKNISVKT